MYFSIWRFILILSYNDLFERYTFINRMITLSPFNLRRRI
jgi:hypothetical protein